MKIAGIQLNSGNNSKKNLRTVMELLEAAALSKPDVIVLPEYANFMGRLEDGHREADSTNEEWHSALSCFSKDKQVHILCGLLEAASGAKSASVIYSWGEHGGSKKLYTKIHLFDADTPDGKSIRESESLESGTKPVTASVSGVMSGFALCYDLRFPELFRHMTLHGAKIIFVPSAFTQATGSSHWEILVRARAIENQVFIVAPNQAGGNSSGGECFGHSMIVDPWGRILAEAQGKDGDKAECIIESEISLDEQAEIRKRLPCLHHIKIYRTI